MKLKWKISIIISIVILVFSIILEGVIYKRVVNMLDVNVEKELNTNVDMLTIIFDEAYPGDWEIKDGKLYKGNAEINNNFQIVDEIKEKTNMYATIFMNDTRVTTNIKDESGNRSVGTKASETVIEAVLKNGQNYEGRVNITGVDVQGYYVPIKDKSDKIIGAYFVGVSYEEVLAQTKNLLISISVISIVMIIIGFIIANYIAKYITKDLEVVKSDIDCFAKGDFSIEMNKKVLNRKDEIGFKGKAVNLMQDGIKSIVKDVRKETNIIEENVNNTNLQLNKLQADIESISATTQ